MPELPEVQVVINYLKSKILNKKIINIEIKLDKLFKNISPKKFKKEIINHSIVDIYRRGKYLLFLLDNNKVILSHLRMEGKYNYESDLNATKHDYIIYHFDDNSFLKYNDTRQFGTIEFFNSLQETYQSKSLAKLGIEPLSDEFELDKVIQLFKNNKKLKTFLLDQTMICGIGNIYANEICYAIRIKPETICNKLTKKDIMLLIEKTKEILNESIEHNGTTIHSFTFNKWELGSYQEKLKIHQQKQCHLCNNKVRVYKINGRGTYCCDKCQKGK